MSQRTRSIIKLIAVLVVLLLVLGELSIVIIPAIAAYKFWLMVIAFMLVLISSK
ncbi:MAG: hypothetical protein ACMVP2_03105 [Imperialibacter sp.]|jgi:hypothetical protein|uniref:hypothetical protein n=1 Tax=unclassified Imperialibacter TaxID=2629706 RepID=UPI00125BAB1C|nr:MULTISPECIES: hypothetical protein [unclassified Imperialibacter]CAD5251033.1 conserved hypothetical protein [Imperialibacter sp. 89]CAD5283888.1 conserved hypothetical protein [Imperialibacter sp. 75]VVT10722.1 conserved hypothetical protein [Imperialibacter sp. EC-SDR9]